MEICESIIGPVLALLLGCSATPAVNPVNCPAEDGGSVPASSDAKQRSTVSYSIAINRSQTLRIETDGSLDHIEFVNDLATTTPPGGWLEAGTTLKCDSSESYKVTTGTTKGTCTVDSAGGTATCTDGNNTSTAKCVSGCGNTSGAGDCSG